jgi:succinate-acetate transporter protein
MTYNGAFRIAIVCLSVCIIILFIAAICGKEKLAAIAGIGAIIDGIAVNYFAGKAK